MFSGFKFASAVVFGPPGSGKTAWASALAVKYLREGLVVAGNFPFDPRDPGQVSAWAEKRLPDVILRPDGTAAVRFLPDLTAVSAAASVLSAASSGALVGPGGREVRVVDLRRRDPLTGAPRSPDMGISEVNALGGPAFVLFASRDEIIGLTDALVLYDEAQHDQGARDWEDLSKRARLWMSMYRHYRLTLVMFTQHLKFIEVYWRRLAEVAVSVAPVLGRLLVAVPHWGFDPETGEPGPSNLFDFSVLVRPKECPDAWVTWPGPLEGWRLSGPAFAHYRTHQPRDSGRGDKDKKTKAPA